MLKKKRVNLPYAVRVPFLLKSDYNYFSATNTWIGMKFYYENFLCPRRKYVSHIAYALDPRQSTCINKTNNSVNT